jgi:Ca2+-binding RTX toxin-like protein
MQRPSNVRRNALLGTVACAAAAVAAFTGAAQAAPVNDARPVISGPARVGGLLLASAGEWSGDAAAEFTYAWQRCEPTGYADCTDIPGGVGTSYLVRPADIGARVRVVVTAATTEAYGSSSTTVPSGTTDVVVARPATLAGDVLLGGPRNDSLSGGAGNDAVDGGGGNDTLGGDEGADSVNGGPGDDRISGGSGNDTINGGNGKDRIFGGDGRDTVSGNAGDDTIDTRDDSADLVNCGAGRDVALVDDRDVVRPGCEVVRRTVPQPTPA